jgi:hypothetical protein
MGGTTFNKNVVNPICGKSSSKYFKSQLLPRMNTNTTYKLQGSVVFVEKTPFPFEN